MDKSCEILLMDYAAGTLDRAHNILVASYLTLSPAGRRYVSDCEALGAAMMEHLCDEATMEKTCLESVLARIDCEDNHYTDINSMEEPGRMDSFHIENCAALPRPLAQMLSYSKKSSIKWTGNLTGIEWIDLKFDDSPTRARLIRCCPGFVLPHHHHHGTEITLVLDGAFEDSSGRYVRGDLVIMDDGSDHKPEADKDLGCVILTLNVSPIRFTGVLTRFLNPFT